jgi:rubrerythrin
MDLANRWQAAHVMLSNRDSAPAPTPPADPVDGLVRTRWTLAVCVVCGHEQPRGERGRASCPGCGAQLRTFPLYRQLRAES